MNQSEESTVDLGAIRERARLAGLSFSEGFEEYAARFYAETGMLPPGKDDARNIHTREERTAEWEAWRRHEWARENKAAVADRALMLAEIERLRAERANAGGYWISREEYDSLRALSSPAPHAPERVEDVEVARVIVRDGRIEDVESIGPTPPDGEYALIPAGPSFNVGEPWRAKIVGVTGGQGLYLEGAPGSLNGWNWDGKLGREVTIRLVLRRDNG